MTFPGLVPMTNVTEAVGSSSASFYNTLVGLGLTTGLKLCLDAGDASSYTSGQKWLDTSGGGYDFYRGTSSSSEATDPSFNGTPGNLSSSEYFSGDGGDYFSYDTTIETWMQTISKSGGVVSFLAVFQYPSASTTILFSTRGSALSDRGIDFRYNTGVGGWTVFASISEGASATSFGSVGLGAISTGSPHIVGMSFTLGSGNSYVSHNDGVNGSGTQAAVTYTSGNPTNNMKLLASGAGGSIAPSGTRLYALAIWQGTALTAGNFTSIYDAIHSRFGL